MASGLYVSARVRVLASAVSAGAGWKLHLMAEALCDEDLALLGACVSSLRLEASGVQHRRQRRPCSTQTNDSGWAEMEGDHQPEARLSHETGDSPEIWYSRDHCDVLLQSLNELRLEGLFCDVVLVADGVKFSAHRLILAVCSDYFNSMFTIGTQEYYQKEVELVGVSSFGCKAVLDYIYNNDLSLDSTNIHCVLKAAQLLQVWGLVDECRKYLEREPNDEKLQLLQELASVYSLEHQDIGG